MPISQDKTVVSTNTNNLHRLNNNVVFPETCVASVTSVGNNNSTATPAPTNVNNNNLNEWNGNSNHHHHHQLQRLGLTVNYAWGDGLESSVQVPHNTNAPTGPLHKSNLGSNPAPTQVLTDGGGLKVRKQNGTIPGLDLKDKTEKSGFLLPSPSSLSSPSSSLSSTLPRFPAPSNKIKLCNNVGTDVILEKLVSHHHGTLLKACQNGKSKHLKCECFVHLALSEVLTIFLLPLLHFL